jgi:hypothetical protein
VLFRASQVLFWLLSLSLLATVRGGTSFLFPSGEKETEAKKTPFNR